MKGFIVIRKELCKECFLCINACERKLIAPSNEFNAKGYHPVCSPKNEECIGCALCATVCPEIAIEVYRE